MIRTSLLAMLLFLTSLGGTASPLAAEEVISLTLPQQVIAKAFTMLLPLRIDAKSKSVQGDIVIKSIKDFQLSNNQLACQLHLAGSNLNLVTDIAGHEIKLKVGAVEIEVQANATLRYDPAQQTLFVKPVVRNLGQTAGKNANADIGQALVALLNGQEFPVTLQNLDPIIAKSGAKTITINTRITDIRAQPEMLKLSLVPQLAAK